MTPVDVMFGIQALVREGKAGEAAFEQAVRGNGAADKVEADKRLLWDVAFEGGDNDIVNRIWGDLVPSRAWAGKCTNFGDRSAGPVNLKINNSIERIETPW